MTKRMTRLLSLILTLVMFLSVATPAYAWGPGDFGGGWDRDIGEDEIRDPDFGPVEEVEEYDYFQALDEENNVQVTIEAPMGSLPSLAEVRLEPVPAEDLQEAVNEIVDGSPVILVAMDISFWLGEDEIEPEEPVRVKISAPELEGKTNLQVIHFPDDAEEPETVQMIPEEDLTFALGTNEIAFQADSFSVYAVIDGQDETTKLTVNFYDSIEDDAEPISTQVLVKTQFDEEEEAPLIDPGVPALTGTQSFEGWSLENPYSASTTRYDIEELNTYIKTNYGSMTENATLNIYAMVFDVFYVTYHDQAGAVLKTESVICPVGGSASVVVTNPYVPFKQGQNFAGWTPDILVKGDYPTYASNPTVYQDGSSYSFSADVRLYPYVKTGNWLTFDNYIDQDTDATSASYTSPVFVENGKNTQEPTTPERTGYTFEGWYTDKNLNTRYTFGGNLTADTTVYAKWSPQQTSYMVVFWQQSANDAVDAADADKTYDYFDSVERTALTGASVSINTSNSGTTADNRRGGNSTSSIGDMGYYFVYNGTNSDTSSAVVKGDGSTVLNVYYDRRVITINFHEYITTGYDYTSGSSNYYSIYVQHYGVNNGSYYYLNMSYNSYYLDGDLVPSNRVTWYYRNSSGGNGSQYTGTIYHYGKSTASNTIVQTLTGLYDAPLANWPDPGDDYKWKSNSGSYNWDYGMTLPVYSYKIWGTDGTTYTDTTWDIWIESSGGADPKTVYYVGQDTDGEYTINLAEYSMYNGLKLTIDHTLFYGYTMHEYRFGTSGSWRNLDSATDHTFRYNYENTNDFGNNSSVTVHYKRNVWDFTYESNGHDAKTESVFFEGSLSGLASYVPTNGPRGCYFDGWYADPGFDTPFDFSQTMPNHAVRIYAKWTLMRFRVVLDPTGGDPNVSTSDVTFPGNQVTTFRLDYGEQVQGSSINNAQRQGYTLLGWYLDPEYTRPFNFGQPITDAVAVMGYNELPAAQRQGVDPWNGNKTYDDADGAHEEVRGKVKIYARWRADPEGTIGVHVTYDAMDGTFPNNNEQIWEDPYIYADQAEAYAQPASTPADTDLHFLYWEIMKPTSNSDPTLISTGKKVYPGQTWDVLVEDAVKEEIDPSGLVLDPANLHVFRSGKATGIMAAETTTVASWDFESSSLPSGWLLTDGDGDGYNWMVMNGSDYSDYAHGGQGYIRSNSYNGSSGTALTPDNWVFSSAVTIPANGTTTLSFWIRAQDPNWPGDIVKVYVCTAQTVATATEVSGDITAPEAYTEETIDLTGYAGQTVYIAFRHYNSTDLFAVNIDDAHITNEAASEFTVRFYDHANTLLSEQTVEKGSNAIPPADPEAYEENGDTYVFIGWDASYSDIQADTDIHAVYILSSQQTVETTRYTVYLHAVYGRMDAGKVTHINFYSNAKDEYGHPIPQADVETKSIEEIKTELGLNTREDEVREVLFYEGGESSKTYDERDGYNLYYDNIKVIEDEMPIPVPYSIEGYRFLGWGRVSDIDSIPEGHQASEYVTDPDELTADNLFLKYVEDESEAGFHWEAQNKSGQWVTVTKVAANEEKPYHDMYAVWEPLGKINWYSNVQDVALQSMQLDQFVQIAPQVEGKGKYFTDSSIPLSGENNAIAIRANDTFTYVGTVHNFLGWAEDPEAETPDLIWNEDHYETNTRAGTTVSTVNVTAEDWSAELGYTKEYYAVWQSEFYVYHSGVDAAAKADSALETIPLTRAAAGSFDLTATPKGLTAGTLYGGYYKANGFTVSEGDFQAWPAYNGSNWTWSTPEIVNGMAMQPQAGETYYIKEVPASMYLQPYFHYTYLKESKPENQALRSAWLISDIDDAMYIETGFVIQTDDKTAYVCTELTVQTTVGGSSVLLKPSTIFRGKGVTNGYLSYLEVLKDGACTGDSGMSTTAMILQYWVTPDGLIVTGTLSRTYGALDTKANVKNNMTETAVESTIKVFEEDAPTIGG